MTLRSHLRLVASAIACVLVAGACDRRAVPMSSADSQAAHVAEVVAAGGVVDSILPIAEQLRRFRADVADHPDTLRHASPSIDALAKRLAKAIASRDTAALVAMTIDRAEFAWLYYPGSKLSKPPYEAPPQLLWGQLLASSDEGARKLLDRLGGKKLTIDAVTCPTPSDTTEVSVVYSECHVRARVAGAKAADNRLFGSIVEHQGRFKFLGYANSL